MHDPIQVYVGSLDLAATHTVTQVIQLIDENEKEEAVSIFCMNYFCIAVLNAFIIFFFSL